MSPNRRAILLYAFPWVLIVLAIVALSVRKHSSDFGLSDGPIDPASISGLSGVQGSFTESTFKVTQVRPGLATTVGGVIVTPEMGLKAWMTLNGTRQHAVLLGDVPLKEEEVNGALRAALDAGITVTSLHNRFLFDSTRIMSLHVEQLGTQEKLSKALGVFWAFISKNRFQKSSRKSLAVDTTKGVLDRKTMEALLWKGKMNAGVFSVSVGRDTSIGGMELGEPTGVNSWAAFAGNAENAAVNGDIATLEFELPFVLEDLIKAGIQVTSIHTHMIEEKPKLIFVHFWGVGKVPALAAGVKAAIWEKEHFQAQ